MKYSIVIPAYLINARLVNLTSKCIQSLRETLDCDYEIIVVNSGHLDLDDEVDTYVKLNKQATFAQAVNIGIRIATGALVAVCNNDVVLPQGWVGAIDKTLLEGATVATLLSSEEDRLPFDETLEDFFGSFWVMSKINFNKVGLMDEQFKNSFGDADYWMRIRLLGGKILKNCNVIVEHVARASVDLDKPKHDEWYIKNRELFNLKWKGSEDPWFQRLK